MTKQPTSALARVPYPPPPARVESVPPRPSTKATWIDGEWTWRGKRWLWVRGRWVEPPKGAVFHYPHKKDQTLSVACAPAPVNIANQMYVQGIQTKLIAQCTQGGKSIAQAIDWAASELEGYMRT